MTLFMNILAGLLVAILIHCFLYIKRNRHKRALKQVLELHDSTCTFVSSTDHEEGDKFSIYYLDAYAFSHVLALGNELGLNIEIYPHNGIPESAQSQDRFSVGGADVNSFTKNCLTKYVKGYRYSRDPKQGKSGEPERTPAERGFTFGRRFLRYTDDEDWAVLIKLNKEVLDQNRTYHLLFGYGGKGTAAAAYYFSKHYQKLYERFGSNKYCVAVKVDKKDIYKNVKETFDDLTTEAFS